MKRNFGSIITKSNFLKGWRCQKNLFLEYNSIKLNLKKDKQTEQQIFLFHQGTMIGILGRNYFGINNGIDCLSSIEETKKSLNSYLPLYEATFQFENIKVACDVLIQNKETKKWNIP